MTPSVRSGVLVLGVVPLAALAFACRAQASAQECQAMLAHYLDLALAETPGSATLSAPQASAVREVQRGLKRANPSYRRVEDDCPSVTRSEVACARQADSTKTWESCVHPADAR